MLHVRADWAQSLEVLAQWPKLHVRSPAANEESLGSVPGTLGGVNLPLRWGNYCNRHFDAAADAGHA